MTVYQGVGKLKQPPASMSGAANETHKKEHVYYLKATNESPHTHIFLKGIMDPVKTLINSGSSWNFIDIAFACTHQLPLVELQVPQRVIAIDGKEVGERVHFRCTLEFEIQGRTFRACFYAMPLGDTPIILGMEWL